MILNKYNEIMNSVTVDPEMKSRIMSSVSAAIKEQNRREVSQGSPRRPAVRKTPESAKVTDIPKERSETPVRKKKANKTPIVVISSIAAGILVIMGVMFVFGYIGKSESAMNTAPATHNATVAEVQEWVDSAAETEAAGDYYAEETTAGADEESEKNYKDDINYASGGHTLDPDANARNSLNAEITIETGSTTYTSVNGSEGMGDARIDGIAKALPFDIKGSGSGQYSETITEEVFFGNGGEKVVLFTAPEGTDLVKTVAHINSDKGIDGTTPDGYALKLYCIGFVNVAELSDDEPVSDVNAAVFTKNGNTYLIVFSDCQPVEVIGRVADAV